MPNQPDPQKTLAELIKESEVLREKSASIAKRLKRLSTDIARQRRDVKSWAGRKKRD